MSMTSAILNYFNHNKKIKISVLIVDHQLEEQSEIVAWNTAFFILDKFNPSLLIVEVASKIIYTGSYEAAARKERYGIIERVKNTISASAVLAHTKDDQAECVLMGLLRGSGAVSIRGMRRENAGYIRPLLDVSKADTKRYCDINKIQYHVDTANSSLRYTRIKIRKLLIPIYRAVMERDVVDNLSKTADLIQEDICTVDSFTKRLFLKFDYHLIFYRDRLLFTDTKKLKVEQMSVRHKYIKYVLDRYYNLLTLSCESVGYVHIKSIDDIICNDRISTTVYNLPENIFFKKTRGYFSICRKSV